MADRGRDPRLTVALVAIVAILVAAVLAWLGGRSGNDDEPANTSPAPAQLLGTNREEPR